ncbi:MAG TPA: 6-pyruvoyl-tetrahydropterin synthase-related protein, partial [Chloroflexota bacterium]|nr:6-pyruvoyl-tetrahydropterin synthase-related protein [Chloroflexota bacterium]
MAASLLTRTTDQRRWPSPLLALQRWSPRVGRLAWWASGLLLALLVTAPAWLPWTSPDLNLLWEEAKGTDDAKHHMLRLYLFEWLTQRGVWYPRWAPDLFMGFGYPVFNYYAPGVYYTGLALRALLRQDIWDAYRSTGVLAALLGAGGTFALVLSVWRRLALGVLAAAAVLYGPYVYQTTLFQRGAVPEALGLGLLPWLPLGAWQTWRAETPGRQAAWLAATALATAALLLTHTLVAAAGLTITLAWTVALRLILPDRAALGRVALALLLGACLAAPYWLPAAGESGAVQLEIGREGHLDPRAWLLDLGGNSEKQQSAENRQTPAGPLDLHLFYPHQHQFVVTLKPGLAQAALALLSVLALLLCRGPSRPAGPLAPLLPPHPSFPARQQALLASPFLALALVCWALLFTFSEPLWRLVPALSLLQWPGRLMGPFGYCVAIAGAGGLGALWTQAEGRSPSWGRAGGWALAGAALGLVLLNGWGGREVPYYPDPKRTMDGRMIVQEEKDSFSHIG